MNFRILLVFLCAALWSADCGGAELTILHTSEHHGTLQPVEDGPYKGLGGVARRAALIERIRQERSNVLVVDSGDLVIGTAMSSVFHGTPDVAAMGLMRYDAQALGNHDFDFGVDHLRELKKQAHFPFLCASVKPKLPGICDAFVIKEVGGLRIGLIGLLGRLTFPDSFDPNVVKELDYRDPIEAAKSAVAALKGRVDLIVAVTHEETDEDLALVRAVPEIDVIVGGHTPGFDGLIPAGGDRPVRGRVEPVARGPIFVKSHQQARTLGRLDLVIDKTIRSAEAENILIDANLPEEPKVAELVKYYNQRLETETQRVVGKAAVDLQGDLAVVRTRETNFGNLLADLALRQAGAEIALINSGSIRATIPVGPVTLKQVMRALPYNDSLVSFKLSGAELWKAMENSVSRLPDSGRFLQMAGVELRFDPTAPVGSRVKSIRFRGAAIQPERQYSVVVNGFMAEGGDGYTMLTSVRDRVDHQSLLRDLFTKALAGGVVDVKEQGRIVEEKP
jgi:2',3'-cyclic-nucleotide 2'-phosphodiesterase (5'-nucleotidase family)